MRIRDEINDRLDSTRRTVEAIQQNGPRSVAKVEMDFATLTVRSFDKYFSIQYFKRILGGPKWDWSVEFGTE